jgi:rod shape-determining protein MreC
VQSQRANQVEQLLLENRAAQIAGCCVIACNRPLAAQVIYDAADPYSRKVVIDKGAGDKVGLGSPVLDESGVLGQVTRVYPDGQ